MEDSLNSAKARIRAAFESGIRMTTAQGNRIGQTVDFRKIVSLLKSEGFEIQSYWNEKDGRRWKTYYHQHPLPMKGTRMSELGQSKLPL
ncbi:MAG: hypothetical protein OSJ31_05465 [Alistipes sp.]|nr:hypothetical protein [Alistipes sp.]